MSEKILILFTVKALDVARIFADGLRYIYDKEVYVFEEKNLKNYKDNFNKALEACNSFLIFRENITDQAESFHTEIGLLISHIKKYGNTGNLSVPIYIVLEPGASIDEFDQLHNKLKEQKLNCITKTLSDEAIKYVANAYNRNESENDNVEGKTNYFYECMKDNLSYRIAVDSNLASKVQNIVRIIKENKSIYNLNKEHQSIEGIRYKHISQKIEHLEENINSIIWDKELKIYRDIVKDFWKESIMQTANKSIYATNIPLAVGSYGRTLAFDLLQAQKNAINRSLFTGVEPIDIQRVFAYTYDEIDDREKNYKLIYLATIQSMIGIKVYMIGDEIFKKCSREMVKNGGVDFMIIDQAGVYITQSKGGQVERTFLKTEPETLTAAKSVWNNIIYNSEELQIYVDVHKSIVSSFCMTPGDCIDKKIIQDFEACINKYINKEVTFREIFTEIYNTRKMHDPNLSNKTIGNMVDIMVGKIQIKRKKFDPVINFNKNDPTIQAGIKNIIRNFDRKSYDDVYYKIEHGGFKDFYMNIEELWKDFKRIFNLSYGDDSKEKEAKYDLLDCCAPTVFVSKGMENGYKHKYFIDCGTTGLSDFIDEVAKFMESLNERKDKEKDKDSGAGDEKAEPPQISLKRLFFELLNIN